MGDVYTKDERCIGCAYYHKSYSDEPCISCSVAFSGQITNHYTSYTALMDDMYPNAMENWGREEEDVVKKPSHYQLFDSEAIDYIRSCLTDGEFKGYLKGNGLKYRLRAGKKDDTEQDIRKALEYEDMYERYFG